MAFKLGPKRIRAKGNGVLEEIKESWKGQRLEKQRDG